MRFFIVLFLFTSMAQAFQITNHHCQRDEISVGFTTISKKASLFRVERLDGKPIFPNVNKDMKGFTILFKNGECTHGTFCSTETDKAEFQAWNLNNFFIDVKSIKSIHTLLTYRLHFNATFEIDGKKIEGRIQKEVGKQHCVGNQLE